MDESSFRESFLWGYGHFVVFASAAAVGAGLAVAVDQVTGRTDLSARLATLCVAVPTALYLMSVWAVHLRAKPRGLVRLGPPCTAALLVVAAAAGAPVLVLGLLLVGLIVFSEVTARAARAALSPGR